jgi:hypothetical protein
MSIDQTNMAFYGINCLDLTAPSDRINRLYFIRNSGSPSRYTPRDDTAINKLILAEPEAAVANVYG